MSLTQALRVAECGRGLFRGSLRPFLFVWLLLGALAVPGPAAESSAQSTTNTPNLLTNAQAVVKLGIEGATNSLHTAQIEGVVTYRQSPYFATLVQDASGAVFVRYTNRNARLLPGTNVRVLGTVGIGIFGAVVENARIEVLGTGPLPEPARPPTVQMVEGGFSGMWVEKDGVVRDVMVDDGKLRIFLSSAERRIDALVNPFDGNKLPADWIDRRVRIQGVCWPVINPDGSPANFTINSPDVSFVTPLTPPVENIFDQKPVPLNDPRLRRVTENRVKVVGTVMQFFPPSRLFIESDGAALQARIISPFKPLNRNSTLLPREKSPAVKPGDVVEVVGAPRATRFGPLMHDAEWRRVGTGSVLPASVIDAPDAAAGKFDGKKVVLRGRLLSPSMRTINRTPERVFRMESDGVEFEAAGVNWNTNGPAIEKDTVIQVTGACSMHRSTDSAFGVFTIYMIDPSDLIAIGAVPYWKTIRPERALAAALVIAVVCAAWIWMLRRQVNQRTASLVTANQQLQREVRERTEAENDLRASENRFRTLVEHAPEGIVVIDAATGCFIEANENALHLLGLTREELPKTSLAALSGAPPSNGNGATASVQDQIAGALAGKTVFFNWEYCDRRGRQFPAEIRLAGLPAAPRRLVIGVISDISERKRAEDEMQRAITQERELNELKSRFISMVSHEFRTPLGIIMSSAEILESYFERLPLAKREEHLRDIFQCSRQMAGLMEEVLVLSRAEAGKIECKAGALDLAALCFRIASEISASTGERCPIFVNVINTLQGAHADENLVRHILANLLANAVKYSPPSTPVELRVERRQHLAIFTVNDRGIGIPDVDARQMFQAFHRGRNVGEIPGTGLGMVIVKRCVELHHGKIGFESQEGAGTRFVIALPLFGPSPEAGSTNVFMKEASGGSEFTIVP